MTPKTPWLTLILIFNLIYLPVIVFSAKDFLTESQEESNVTIDETELQRQILALDDYVFSEMITKHPNKTTPPPNDVADLRILGQIYESTVDKLTTSAICTACNVGIGYLMFKVRVSKFNATDIESVTTFTCNLFHITTPEVCSGISERFTPVLSFIFEKRPKLTANTFCGFILQSFGCTTYAPELEWTVDIPPQTQATVSFLRNFNQEDRNRIQNLNQPIKRLISEHGVDNTGRIKIIQLSDLHIDPRYEPGANAECDNKILCCEGSQGRPLNKSSQAGEFGDHRKCDSPYGTLESALANIAEKHGDAELIYMTGDIVPHNVWSTTEVENTKVINKTTQMILQYFPKTKVIPLLGNHETHPVNLFSPPGVPEELSSRWIYRTTFELYKQWIPENQWDLYLANGYYAVEINDKFKIIVLNTNLHYELNFWQMYEPGDTGDQLKWFIGQLQESENKDQMVHIVGHVPPGYDDCFRVFSRNFYNIILRFHHVVKGQFYGHTHNDQVKVYYDLAKQPISNLWISPSLTAYEINNMAYRIYYADPHNYEIMDHETWLFDLITSNKILPTKLHWFSSYSGSASYGLPDTTPKSMGDLVNKMSMDKKTFQKFYQHYHKVLDNEKLESCSTFCQKQILCRIVSSYNDEVENCNRIQKQVDGIVLPISVLRQG